MLEEQHRQECLCNRTQAGMPVPHENRLRVRYAETDQMGVVYYANYLVWMETGRVELCKAMGFNYKTMEANDGVLLTVVEANCRYLSPARFDDEVIVRTRVASVNLRMVRFAYEIVAGDDGRMLATGETSHLFCGRDFRRVKLPEKYWALFGIR